MSPHFLPGDHVRALLRPELGTGTIQTVSKGTKNIVATRVAKVAWSTGQKSTHSFIALTPAGPATAGGP